MSTQQLHERVRDLESDNAELNNLVRQLLQAGDELFASRTWKIGYAIANLLRRALRLFGNRASQWHIGPEHFRRMAENCHAFSAREGFGSGRLDGSAENIPRQYVAVDVETALKDLWQAVGKDYAENG